jgi:orotate phosphoribosyltransferase
MKRDLLLNILVTEAIEFGPTILASGVESDVYVNIKKLFTNYEAMDGMTDWLDININTPFTVIGGVATGAIPLLSVLLFKGLGINCKGFWVNKDDSEGSVLYDICGYTPDKGDKVVIVEDVVTTGGTVTDLIRAVRGNGAEVVAIRSIVDREQGGREVFSELGITDYQYAFTLNELLECRKQLKGEEK